MIASLVLFESEFLNIVSISFSALVLNELIMVAVEVTTWHTLMILSEVFTLALYVVSIMFLPEYFGESHHSHRVTLGQADSLPGRPLLRPLGDVRLEGLAHRRHLCRTAVGHQGAQESVRTDLTRQAGILRRPRWDGAVKERSSGLRGG